MVSSHPNIAALVATYEDIHAVHLLLELCEGGELFDRIASTGSLTEAQAARYFRKARGAGAGEGGGGLQAGKQGGSERGWAVKRAHALGQPAPTPHLPACLPACVQMVEVARHCHALGIVHRDIKPENVRAGGRGRAPCTPPQLGPRPSPPWLSPSLHSHTTTPRPLPPLLLAVPAGPSRRQGKHQGSRLWAVPVLAPRQALSQARAQGAWGGCTRWGGRGAASLG